MYFLSLPYMLQAYYRPLVTTGTPLGGVGVIKGYPDLPGFAIQ
jgi:hypothetical protein